MSTAALIVAAGRGHRAGGTIPKQYQVVGAKSILAHTVSCFARHPGVDHICVAIHPDDHALFDAAMVDVGLADADLIFGETALMVAEGGATRQISVLNGLEARQALPGH